MLLSVLNRRSNKLTASCKPTNTQTMVATWVRIALTTLSITRAVIVTLTAGIKPRTRLNKASELVSHPSVDHTRRKTRGRLVNASKTCEILNRSSDSLCLLLPGLVGRVPFCFIPYIIRCRVRKVKNEVTASAEAATSFFTRGK